MADHRHRGRAVAHKNIEGFYNTEMMKALIKVACPLSLITSKLIGSYPPDGVLNQKHVSLLISFP